MNGDYLCDFNIQTKLSNDTISKKNINKEIIYLTLYSLAETCIALVSSTVFVKKKDHHLGSS